MGYKTEIFTSTVDENLCCSICREVFQDPVSCKSGHTFCRVCISEWLRTHNKCPLDNVALAEQDLVHNLAIKGIIENLQVSCHNNDQSDANIAPGPNKKPRVEDGQTSDVEERCEWIGKLCDLARHQLACPFQLQNCPNSTCCEKIQRRKVEDHKRVCRFRTVVCRSCGMSLVYNEQVRHKYYDCPMELISCTNKCTTSYGTITKIQRCNLADHINKVCDNAIIPCAFQDQGCSDKILQKDLEKHLQEKMSLHMLLLAKENKQLRRELAKTKETNKSFIWQIKQFPSKASGSETGSCLLSPMFWLCGYKWIMRAYPKGKVDERYMTLMLNKVEDCDNNTPEQPNQITCEGLNAHVICSLSVLKAKPNESDYVRTFNIDMYKDAQNWMNGWSDFMPCHLAVSPKYCNQSGVLNIQCTMQVTYTE